MSGQMDTPEGRDAYVRYLAARPDRLEWFLALFTEKERKRLELALDKEDTVTEPDRVCPCCKGARGRWQHFEVPEVPDSWDHAEGETCECHPRFDACLCCNGSGELVGLARATLLARGDIAPVARRTQ